MDNFKPKIHIEFKGNKCDITVKCPDCGKELLRYENVLVREIKKRKATIEKTLVGCLHCNLEHADMCKGIPRRISVQTAIMNLSKF